MDQTFSDATNLTIISLGMYLGFFFPGHAAGVFGVFLVLFGGCFALADRLRRPRLAAFKPE
jgi:hypothetical protein